MRYSWNRQLDNVPTELTTIWTCTSDECNGWMRDDFSFKAIPVCQQCQSSMAKSQKELPVLISSDHELKNYKKNNAKTVTK